MDDMSEFDDAVKKMMELVRNPAPDVTARGDVREAPGYDSPQRRAAIQAHLERIGISPELRAIRGLLDVSQGRPPQEAVPHSTEQHDAAEAADAVRWERERQERLQQRERLARAQEMQRREPPIREQ